MAAGSGSRTGLNTPKQYIKIGDNAVIHHTILQFVNHPKIDAVRVIYSPEHADIYQKSIAGLNVLSPIKGGASRQESVRLGLESLAEFSPKKVLIHDAARPFVSPNIISNVVNKLNNCDAAIPVILVEDTLKKIDNGQVSTTVSRDNLARAQTPQGFSYGKITQAHQTLKHMQLTDDASLFEQLNLSVETVLGQQGNFKITTEDDLKRAEKIMQKQYIPDIRCGTGFDVHKFCEPKNLENNSIMLCGIAVPHDKSLKGHSDSDVAMHAVVDALLGAVSEGDIGEHFPPSDDSYKGMASEVFLKKAKELVEQKNGVILNIDVTIICENPKLQSYKKAMAAKLADILQIEKERVSVKATTTEKLGFTGRSEGIAAQSSASVFIKRLA